MKNKIIKKEQPFIISEMKNVPIIMSVAHPKIKWYDTLPKDKPNQKVAIVLSIK